MTTTRCQEGFLPQVRVVHVVSGILEEASGPSYSVVRLCRALLAAGEDARIMTLDWGPVDTPIPFVEQYSRWSMASRLGIAPSLRRALTNAASRADVIHSHGLWRMPNIYPGWAVKGTKCCLVVSPRGMLSPWALNHSRWRKQVFGALLQWPAIANAACFHATAESEYEDIRRAGFRHQPVCVIPNGVDLPELGAKRASSRRVLLYLGRIHVKKGVDILLHAWSQVSQRFRDWELRIVGSDRGWDLRGGYLDEMLSLSQKLKLERVTFLGPLYGDDKTNAYRDAELFVLPTRSENFGLTVAEALAAGTPVIVTKGAPWEGLQREGAGWWVDLGVDPLIASLEEAMALSPEPLGLMGLRGREWMIRDFSWDSVAETMVSVYRWIACGGERPGCVREG